MQGLIFDIKRFAVHDGPGIRQTIFFKGCPLDCIWCHNPESKAFKQESFNVLRKFENYAATETETVGRWVSPNEIMESIEKDRVFFEESQGGVTFSGGEPMLQIDFLFEILILAKKSGIHTCVDTCGYAPVSSFEKIISFTDLFLYDVKMTDNEKHKQFTGVSNEQILSNLKFLDYNNKNVIIRYPLIPGINDSENDVNGLAALINSLKNIRTVSLLPFHGFSESKHKKFGYNYRMSGTKEPEKDQTDKITEMLKSSGITVRNGS